MSTAKEEQEKFLEKVRHSGVKEFVTHLHRKINEHNLTHEQVAHIVGKSRTTITMWLTGKANLGVDSAILLADFFKISLKTKQEEGEEHA